MFYRRGEAKHICMRGYRAKKERQDPIGGECFPYLRAVVLLYVQGEGFFSLDRKDVCFLSPGLFLSYLLLLSSRSPAFLSWTASNMAQ